MLYKIEDGTLMAGGHMLLAHFNLEIKDREHIALVGDNGVGKTTLLRLIAGENGLERDDRRRGPGIVTSGNITVGMLRQMPFEGIDTGSMTVREYRDEVCSNSFLLNNDQDISRQGSGSYDLVVNGPASADMVKKIMAADGSQVMPDAESDISAFPDMKIGNIKEKQTEFSRIFTEMGFSMEDMDRKLSEFSGGQQTKIALIPLMIMNPDILLLDEPTNHLDIGSAEKLEDYIRQYNGAVLCVSHDRFFLDEIADSVLEIEHGSIRRYRGNYSAFREQKLKSLSAAEKAYERQQEEIRREEDLIKRFKNKPRKASFARSRKKILSRMKLVEKPAAETAHIFTGDITPEMPGPKLVLEAEKLKTGYDSPLMEISIRIKRGQKIGIIGPNGAGKSTFIKTVAGLIPSLDGKCRISDGATVEYFDQQTAEKLGSISDISVLEYFTALFPSVTQGDAGKYLASYLFRGKDVTKTPAMLSGGERSRLALAIMLYIRPNLLILDEPTNHMDIPARETMESAFRAYKGTIIFISHDRYFTAQVADSLLIMEHGKASYYPFGYRHYLQRRKALGSRKDTGGEMNVSAQVLAEDEALISGLKNVPRGSAMQSRQMSTEQAHLDWRLNLAAGPLEEAGEQVKRLSEELEKLKAKQLETFAGNSFSSDLNGYNGDDFEDKIRAVREDLAVAQRRYYELSLEWYDVWQDTGFREDE